LKVSSLSHSFDVCPTFVHYEHVIFSYLPSLVQTWWQITGHSNHLAFESLLCLHDLLTGCHLKSDVKILNSISPSSQSARDHRSAQSHQQKIIEKCLVRHMLVFNQVIAPGSSVIGKYMITFFNSSRI